MEGEKEKKKVRFVDDGVSDPMGQLPRTKFQKFILKSMVGEKRADQVLTSMSMAIIPKNIGGGLAADGKYCFNIHLILSMQAYKHPGVPTTLVISSNCNSTN